MPKHYSSHPEPDKIPASVNPNLQNRKRKDYETAEYLKAILEKNRMMLARAMTLVGSKHQTDREKARDIVEACLQYSGQSFRLGITGVPGVGKSTFIETLGQKLIDDGHSIAVLTVDPSSQVNKGSILGDKTRMPILSTHPKAFIRPSPARESLGGVAAKTRELILLCEAAGFDFIIIETVGVGQSEVAVHGMTDFFLLLLLPSGGDELQGIKRGVVEMADMIAINKADGDRIADAKKAKTAYQNALHLFPTKASNWVASAVTCSALEEEGIDFIIENLDKYKKQTSANGYLTQHRQEQAIQWFKQYLNETILAQFFEDDLLNEKVKTLERQVAQGIVSPQAAVEALFVHK